MTTQPATPLSIAEVAERTGLTAHTLRYYERDGLLLRAVDRASSGHRRYNARDVDWIVMISRLRATGMPISEVRRYADMCRHGDGNETARLEILHSHRDRVVAQLAEVSNHLRAIERKIDIYQDRLVTRSAGQPDQLDEPARSIA